MTYLDPAPFDAQDIAVAPFQRPATGISTGRRVTALWAVAALGPPAVAARFHTLAAAPGPCWRPSPDRGRRFLKQVMYP
ncbi:hypothetical protein [Streptomyces sp. SGAir0957]